MSIATEITRLQNAKTAIKTSIENKGVVVADNLTIDGYSALIDDIDTDVTLQTKTITENGTFLPDSGYDGLSSVTVDVAPTLQNKTVTENGDVTADNGYDGLGIVSVNVQPDLETLSATENGTYTPSGNVDGYSTVTVNVQPDLETLNVTTNGTYTSSNYDGYSTVTVNVESGGGSTQYDTLVFTDSDSGIVQIATKYAKWENAAYSEDNTNWVSLTGLDGWTPITNSEYTVISYTSGGTLYFRFTNRVVLHTSYESGIKTTSNTVVSGDLYNGSAYAYYKLFTNSEIVSAENLNFHSTVAGSKWGYYMFYNCTSLTTAPELPATNLATECYVGMFKNCSALTTAPSVLPATTLASYCYQEMFSSCNSLTTAPELPATTLADYCYQSMFTVCTSLTTAPELPATTLANYCYSGMFSACSALTTAPVLPATTLANYCYSYMFRECTSLTTAPELPATTLNNNCYYEMFKNCQSLTTAPELPATTLASGCYGYMFRGCSNLKYIKAMFITTPSTSYTRDWVNSVASEGTFVKNSAATWDTASVTGTNGVPSGWTVETADA